MNTPSSASKSLPELFAGMVSNRPSPLLRLALLATWLAVHTSTPARAELRVVPPEAPFAGSTLSQWAVAWWRWYYEIPGATNPRTDRTGRDAAQGQHGPVWFFADGFVPSIVRHIQVPSGRALLIPVVEQSWVATLPNDPRTVNGILRFLQPFELSDLKLTVDGAAYTNLPAHFLQSELMDPVTVGDSHPSGTPAGSFGPALGQGLFVLLEAPTPGRHQVRFAARWRPQTAIYEVTYEIEVLPPPPALAIGRSSGQTSTSWSTNATDYVLEQATTPDTTDWQSIDQATAIDGAQFIQAVETSEPARFFRLRRQAELGLRVAEPFNALAPNDASLVSNGGGTGLNANWLPGGFNAQQSSNYRVENESLAYPELRTSAGRVRTASSSAITGVTRAFSAAIPNIQSGNSVYFLSILARAEGVLNAGAFNGFFGLYLTGSSDLFIGKGGDGVSKDWIVEERGGLYQLGTRRAIKLNQTDLLVVKFDFRAPRRAFVYVNPPLAGGEPLIPDLVYTRIPASFSRVTLYSSGAHSLDELRLGTSFAAVTPPGP